MNVWVRNAAGDVSAMASDSTVLDLAPPEPGSLSAETIQGGVRLSWSGFSDEHTGVASFRVVGQEGEIAP